MLKGGFDLRKWQTNNQNYELYLFSQDRKAFLYKSSEMK